MIQSNNHITIRRLFDTFIANGSVEKLKHSCIRCSQILANILSIYNINATVMRCDVLVLDKTAVKDYLSHKRIGIKGEAIKCLYTSPPEWADNSPDYFPGHAIIYCEGLLLDLTADQWTLGGFTMKPVCEIINTPPQYNEEILIAEDNNIGIIYTHFQVYNHK